MVEKIKVNFILQGKEIENLKEIKQETGIRSTSDVFRYLIKQHIDLKSNK